MIRPLLVGRAVAPAAVGDALLGRPVPTPHVPEPDAGDAGFQVVSGGVAILSLNGPLTKYRSSLAQYFGGTSMLDMRRALRAAAADDGVKAILLHVDSPGGTVAGTHDLADDVAAAAERKPLFAYIEDLGASAALCVAAQAAKVYANRNALVGSIGTVMVVHDLSKQADEIGVKVHVVSTGFMKGAGTPGAEVTDEQLADLQRMVDEMFQQFRDDLVRGRGLSKKQVDQLATGQLWVGQGAAELGLIDGVESLDETIEQLRQAARPSSNARAPAANQTEVPMGQNNEKTAAATIAELKAAFPNDAEFALSAAEKGLTLVEAKADYADHLQARLQNRDEELEQTKAELAEAKKTPATSRGAAPVEEDCELVLTSRKGSDPDQWPEDLRVRQYPGAAE